GRKRRQMDRTDQPAKSEPTSRWLSAGFDFNWTRSPAAPLQLGLPRTGALTAPVRIASGWSWLERLLWADTVERLQSRPRPKNRPPVERDRARSTRGGSHSDLETSQSQPHALSPCKSKTRKIRRVDEGEFFNRIGQIEPP